MATEEKTLNETEMTLVRRTLESVELSDRLMAARTAESSVSFAELYAYATRGDHTPSDALATALASDGRIRRDFERLLRNVATYSMPQVAAASSGAVTTREIAGCRITFRPSKAEAEQIFAIIELTDTSARPGALFVCGDDGGVAKISLPAPRNGRIQLLLDTNSDIAQGLQDVETEVFLR